MKSFVLFLLIVVSAAFALIRPFIESHELSPTGTYEAFVHIWVGILIGLIIVSKNDQSVRRLSFIVLVCITAVEIVAFLANKN